MKAVLVLGIALLSSAAMAAIPETTKMYCKDAQDYVKRNSPTVLTTNGKMVRYVYESNGSDCFDNESAVQVFVKTKNYAHCAVAYTCEDSDFVTSGGSISSDND